MAKTKQLGSIGEAMIISDTLRRGYQVAIPLREDWRFDLVVYRKGKLERLQCKYTRSDGNVITVRCRSVNNWNIMRYTMKNIDWMAVYDATTNACYYIPSRLLGKGRSEISLRILPPKNNQKKHVLWAKDFILW